MLLFISLVVFLYPRCLTNFKGANHTCSLTVPLWRQPAAIQSNSTQFYGTYFGLAGIQTHSFDAGIISRQNHVMFTELDTITDKENGEIIDGTEI